MEQHSNNRIIRPQDDYRGDRISPADRWAIVAYIRTLQMSQGMPFSQAKEVAAR
jgi:hypothetical protein